MISNDIENFTCMTTNDIGQIPITDKGYLSLVIADALFTDLLHDAFLEAAEDGCRLLGDRQCRVLGHAGTKGRLQGGQQNCNFGQVPGDKGDFFGYRPWGLGSGLEEKISKVKVRWKFFPLLKKRWPDVVKYLMIDFDWPVRNRRENALPLDLNFWNWIFLSNYLKLNS